MSEPETPPNFDWLKQKPEKPRAPGKPVEPATSRTSSGTDATEPTEFNPFATPSQPVEQSKSGDLPVSQNMGRDPEEIPAAASEVKSESETQEEDASEAESASRASSRFNETTVIVPQFTPETVRERDDNATPVEMPVMPIPVLPIHLAATEPMPSAERLAAAAQSTAEENESPSKDDETTVSPPAASTEIDIPNIPRAFPPFPVESPIEEEDSERDSHESASGLSDLDAGEEHSSEHHVTADEHHEHDEGQSPTAIVKNQLPQVEPSEPPFPSLASGTIFEEPERDSPWNAPVLGHTEVLKAEDLDRARQSWPSMDAIPAPAGQAIPASRAEAARYRKEGEEYAEQAAPPPNSSRAFIILASYASAITIALIMLILLQIYQHGHPHQLESLPDVAPQKERELTYAPPNMRVPPGHTLHFGETQRFGNIRVEPLAIVEEPAQYVHYSGDANRKKPATRPVWKLKVRLTNVSTEQDIAPLDRALVLRWVSKAGSATDFSNYYITQQGASKRDAPMVQLLHLPPNSDWDLLGQDLGRTLKPGESYETYLASAEDGLDSLPDNLVWRVQIRKGYSPKGNGVTTIFQVAFKKEDVGKEAGSHTTSTS